MAGDIVLDKIKDNLLNLDPIYFVEKYLTLDGKPFRLKDSGYKPLTDIYRTVGIKSLEKNSKPIVILKSRQVGMTTMATAMEMFFMASGQFGINNHPPIRVIHAFPQLDLAFAYSKTKLNPMIINSIAASNQPKGAAKLKSHIQSLIDSDSPTNDSLQFKQFIGGNHIWVESVGLDGNRLRGRTCDVLMFDECQEMSSAAISNSLKVLTKAQYGSIGEGVQVYFGTPKQKGSDFWKLWESSSQQYYYLGCEKCSKHFPFYTPGSSEWEQTWVYNNIVRCSFCGHEQDKAEAINRGKWVATRDPTECKLIGFHINQLYLPDFTKEYMISLKPGIHPTNTERAYQNEVLGEFFQGESTLMTPEEIREKCGDPERKFRARIGHEDNVLTFLGIDIGAKGDIEQIADRDGKLKGQSYSVAVIVTVSTPGRISIDYAVKFKKNDLESKRGIIAELMKKYSVDLAVIDIGFTNDLSEILQTEYGDKFISSESLHRVNAKARYNKEIFPKKIQFERDYWISEIYEQMKRGNVRFPLGSYEGIAWLIQHCCGLELKPSVSRGGDVSARYVKNNFTDGFFALLNAFLAYKFYITDGFKNNNPLLQNNDKKTTAPPISLGYITRKF